MKQAPIYLHRSNDLELLQCYTTSASLCSGIVAGLSRKGRVNLIMALHQFTGQFACLDGGSSAEPPHRLN